MNLLWKLHFFLRFRGGISPLYTPCAHRCQVLSVLNLGTPLFKNPGSTHVFSILFICFCYSFLRSHFWPQDFGALCSARLEPICPRSYTENKILTKKFKLKQLQWCRCPSIQVGIAGTLPHITPAQPSPTFDPSYDITWHTLRNVIPKGTYKKHGSLSDFLKKFTLKSWLCYWSLLCRAYSKLTTTVRLQCNLCLSTTCLFLVHDKMMTRFVQKTISAIKINLEGSHL